MKLGVTRGEPGTGGAIFSPCRTWRYMLWRRTKNAYSIVPNKGVLLFILVNPSVAGEIANDHTLSKAVGFGEKLGYGVVVICNPFAFVSQDIRNFEAKAKAGFDVVGPDNNETLRYWVDRSDEIIVGWSKYGKILNRGAVVLDMIRHNGKQAKALRINQDGSPAHPLMLPYSCVPINYPQTIQKPMVRLAA